MPGFLVRARLAVMLRLRTLWCGLRGHRFSSPDRRGMPAFTIGMPGVRHERAAYCPRCGGFWIVRS